MIVLIDVDGTAVRWGDFHERYFLLMKEAYGWCIGNGELDMAAGDRIFFDSDSDALLRERGIEPKRFWGALESVDMRRRFEDVKSGQLAAYEDVAELYGLRPHGIHYAWITNLPYQVGVATLSGCGLEVPAMTGGNYRGHKPDGNRVRAEMRKYEIPAACALVGDTAVDMQTASALGVPGILVNRNGNNYNGPEPYAVIDSLHGLPRVFKGLDLL